MVRNLLGLPSGLSLYFCASSPKLSCGLNWDLSMEPSPATPPPGPSLPALLMHKNRLQEYCQRAALHLPVYQTVDEGQPHDPHFRSMVFVDGAAYTSVRTFQNRKAAEQDVAKLALETIVRKVKDEGLPEISEDTVFCKSILNEFATKMHLPKPSYSVFQTGGSLRTFTSSLVFDGSTHSGSPATNKKEAEQKAARSAIQFILGNSSFGTVLSQIIKSKAKFFAAIHGHNVVNSSANVLNGAFTVEASGAGHTGALLPAPSAMVPIISNVVKAKEEVVCDSFTGSVDNRTALSNQSLAVAALVNVCTPSQPLPAEAGTDGNTQREGCIPIAGYTTQVVKIDPTTCSKRRRKRKKQNVPETAKKSRPEEQ